MEIGRYEVIRKLGEGGTAKVLLGRALATNQSVVLKVPLGNSADQLERVRDEARVGLRLSHPGIVETLDLIEHEGKPILVVEYVDGASLHQIRKVGPLAPPAVVRVGHQVAAALDAIHSAVNERDEPLDMLHRDVTPANILITKSGDAKLIDLGIARSAETQARQTQSGAVRGTLRYLAPELIEGQKHSAATDLWALGVVMWEAVLGRRAVVGDDREILTHILRGEIMKYQPGEALDPRLHDALAALIAPATARIQKAKAAANILGRLEAAFGDGQAGAQAAVEMALRLSPDDDTLEIGDHTKQILAQQPAPVTMPEAEAFKSSSPSGRKVAGLDDSMEEQAQTVQMQAVDLPRPPSALGSPPSSTGAAPNKIASGSVADVAPVSEADLNNPVTGRYTQTEQAMPAVPAGQEAQAPSSPALGLQPHTEPDPLRMSATSSGESDAMLARQQKPKPPKSTSIKALGVSEDTEQGFDNPFDESDSAQKAALAQAGGKIAGHLKSTQLLQGGLTQDDGEAATIKAMPAMTSVDEALAATQMAKRPPPVGPAASGPTGTAVSMPAAASRVGSALPPIAAPAAPAPAKAAPKAAAPKAAAPRAPMPAAPAPSPSPVAPNSTVPQGTPGRDLAAPPLAAPSTADGDSKKGFFEQATREAPYRAPGAELPAAAEHTKSQPTKAKPAAAPAAKPAAPLAASSSGTQPSASEPAAAGTEPFQMTVTQAFFTKDVQAAIAADAAGAHGPATLEMEAAIAPVEGKIAGLIAALVVVGALVLMGGYWLFGGDDAAGDQTTGAGADAGQVDAGGGGGGQADTKQGPAANIVEKPKPKTRKGKRRGKRSRKRKRKH